MRFKAQSLVDADFGLTPEDVSALCSRIRRGTPLDVIRNQRRDDWRDAGMFTWYAENSPWWSQPGRYGVDPEGERS